MEEMVWEVKERWEERWERQEIRRMRGWEWVENEEERKALGELKKVMHGWRRGMFAWWFWG